MDEICPTIEIALNCRRLSADAQFEEIAIVLVNDDEDGRTVSAHYLQKLFSHAQISSFSSAEDALASMENKWPQAIVTDHRLVGMTGIGFIRAIRMRDANVPIVMVSGLDTVAKEALAAGASVFLPIGRVNELGPTLRKLL